MSTSGVVVGIAVVSGIGILLTALALHRAGRPKASPPRTGQEDPATRTTSGIVAWRGTEREPHVLEEPLERVYPRVVPTPRSPVRIESQRPEIPTPNVRRLVLLRSTPDAPVQPRKSIVLRPVSRPYWDLTHWREDADRLTGFYRTPWGSFDGFVLFANGERPQFYIVHPPAALREHTHWRCFHDTGQNNETYSVHLYPAPKDPDAGILAIEKVLGEALANQGRRNA